MRTRPSRAALLLCATATATVACTGGTPEPPPSDPAQTSAAGTVVQAIPETMRPAAEAFARYRKIDACGLHDPAAASAASGEGSKGDRIMPEKDGFNHCTLKLAKSEFSSTWTIYLTVAEEFDAGRRREAAPEQFAGMEILVQEEGQPLPSCSIIRPLDQTYAIVLDVKPDDRTKVVRPPCDFARDYVTRMAETWKNPPQRGSGRTAPDLPLALRDPCDAVAAVTEDMGQGAKIMPREPYKCTIQPGPAAKGTKTAAAETTVVFGVDESPDDLVKSQPDKYKTSQVGGFTVVSGVLAGTCRNYAIWDAATTVIDDNLDDDPVPNVQVVRIDTPDCDGGRALVEKILAKVGKP
ncbi:hypothetical protein [Saccharothrix sp.]|uniref:hypothetical protein n=1 Tax=Saccharothrix sp. TaxID=1873460 RepID=UPI0028110125|nr:hypothetical protein [Saccharothrix sp.]